jgi:hypothetical protein
MAGSNAEARSNGIIDFSGQDGLSCDTHHAGGVAPEVAFEGPTTVAAGQTALYRFVVRSHGPEQVAAGLNVSANGGILAALPSSGIRAMENARTGEIEITHTQPRGNDQNDEASWLFTWQAPEELEEDTLFGAGNSIDGFGDESGDESAATTIDVRVRCAGDCSDDETVTVDELVRGIDVALGGEPIDDCPLVDGNGDGSVSISELVAAVDSAVNGCP